MASPVSTLEKKPVAVEELGSGSRCLQAGPSDVASIRLVLWNQEGPHVKHAYAIWRMKELSSERRTNRKPRANNPLFRGEKGGFAEPSLTGDFLYSIVTFLTDAPLAQLDRALDYELIGQGFEPLRVRHYPIAIRSAQCPLLSCPGGDGKVHRPLREI